MVGAEINWARWFLYLVVGLPLLVWLFATKSSVPRMLVLLVVIVFIQDVFVWRRYVVAVGIGPAIILGYVALMGLVFQRGGFPSLGTSGGLWILFLVAAALGAVIGSFGTGLLFFNIAAFQEYYLEGLFFFAIGLMALRDDEETDRFFFWFIAAIAFGVALLHVFELLTGWRPPDIAAAAKTKGVFHGSVFVNPNSLADFYAMTIPVALMLFLRGQLAPWKRAAVGGAIVAMGASLVFTAARGGMLFTAAMSLVALLVSGVSFARVFAAALAGAVLLGGVYVMASLVFPDLLGFTEEQLAREGLETNRWVTWGRFLMIWVDHPFGVGLLPENMRPIAPLYGTPHTTAHNMYLDQAVKMGVQGLLAFLLLVGHIVRRNWQAIRAAADDPRRRRVLVYSLLTTVGFLVGGFVEPIYNNGTKLNELFWLLCGVSYASSARALARVALRAPVVPHFAAARSPTAWNG